ncbi:hypothetical protein [Polaromonas sp.]|uniref:hypothetical protein n=1 Tax=Polaromonas sp. TaxID=1869339 RepID=UPI0013B9EA4A|nr:hypothetical protein [Polaromonas sp.]NDP64788.1 hypothetical protein [Polaromonas sp.]
MRTLLTVSLAISFLSACSKSPTVPTIVVPPVSSVSPASSAGSNPAVAAELITIQTSSPDQAVKSWWRYLDLVEAQSSDDCKLKQAQTPPNHLKYLPQVSSGDVLAERTPKKDNCLAEVIAREIDEVKTESETRAIVFTSVRNVTPLPVGSEVDEYDKKWRTEGFKFKYLVEKVGGEWKITQVYKYDESNKYLKRDIWEKTYKPSNKPHVSAYIHRQ